MNFFRFLAPHQLGLNRPHSVEHLRRWLWSAPPATAAASGAASLDLAVGLYIAPHVHMQPSSNISSLHRTSCCRHCACRLGLLAAQPPTKHSPLSSARACWQVPGCGSKRPILSTSLWRGRRFPLTSTSPVSSRLGSIAPTHVGASERDVCVGARPPLAAYPTGGGLGRLRRPPDVRGRRQGSNSGPFRLVPLAAAAQPRLAPRSQAPPRASRRPPTASP